MTRGPPASSGGSAGTAVRAPRGWCLFRPPRGPRAPGTGIRNSQHTGSWSGGGVGGERSFLTPNPASGSSATQTSANVAVGSSARCAGLCTLVNPLLPLPLLQVREVARKAPPARLPA